ncbi:MAG: endopeptidase La, partial [Verrucomicrobia bacterium]
ILPIRGFVLFPGAVLPLTVSRPASIKLLDETLPITKVVGFLTQRDEQKEEPAPQDLYDVGTAAIVLKLLRQAEDQLVIVVQGLRRFAIRKIVAMQPYLRAEIDLAQSIVPEQSSEWQAEFQNLRDSATRLAQLRPDVPEEAA